ncbi:hypothetical protein HDV04_001012 [Boothiomyces sp. JEL0838]|nr:hypothetical protein HDV04_001012 [Boothiomyces sp. JEL0838]
MQNINPEDPALVASVWANINEGWEVVKVLEIIIVPYCYLILGRNKVAELLVLATAFAVLHNIFAMIAYYVVAIYPDADTTGVWICQALCAAIIRIIEMVVNYMIVTAMVSNYQSLFFKIITGVASVIVLFGRVFDVLQSTQSNFMQISKIRWGMAIVSIGGVLQSVVGLGLIYMTIRGRKKASKTFTKLVAKSSFRIIFIQFIDILLIADFLYLKTNLYFLWVHQVADNLDNSRTLLLMLDVLISKFMLTKTTCNCKTLNNNKQ